MVLSEEIGDWIDGEGDEKSGVDHNLLIWNLGARDEHEVLRHIMSHLWSRGWSSILILDHTVMELWRHSNNHVIVVWVEVSTLWNIETKWWIIVVARQQVVWVIDQTWVVRCGFGQIWWADTEVGVLGLMDGHVWWPHSVVNNSLSKVPLLEEVTSVFLMGWVELW